MLKRVIVPEWTTISSEETSKLVQSMPKRFTGVLRRKEITPEERKIIIKLRNEGKTLREIGKIVGRTHFSIQRVINNYTSSKSVISKPRFGRPSKLSFRKKGDLNLGDDFWFQQDNDPKHTAHNVKLWPLYNIENLLRSPPHTRDLNPIKHLWDLLEIKIRQHHITSKEMLKRVIVPEWTTISSEETSKLVQSMPKRFTGVLRPTRGLLATDHKILNHGQVTWMTPELAPPLLTTVPREDVSALDRFNVHRCPIRWVFSGTGLELVICLP
ncbi:uncharacterized protein TNCV_3484571 [Trichonephila clavipes]|nr:uncharacterized protein TNCV_3484571 [Trichonephila clavipes]